MEATNWSFPLQKDFKEPSLTRMELTICLVGYKRLRNKIWLADAWQDYCYPCHSYGARPGIYQAGIRYILSRPRLRKLFDKVYNEVP